MAINAYLNFNGNCREAVGFYADVFGAGEPQIMTFGDLPPNQEHPVPEGAKMLVMHARLDVFGGTLMFSDTFPGMPYAQGDNISLSLTSNDKGALEAAYEQLKVGGRVTMEPQETFWSKYYGSVTDKFGIQWQFSLEESSPS